MDTSSRHISPRRDEETPQSSVAPRRSVRQDHTPIMYKYYALMTQVMNVAESLNF
jgi:hypothetical protein